MTVTITNIGEQAGTKVVDFGIVDGVDETGEFSLEPGESTSVTFEWPTEQGDMGTYTAFGESEDSRDEASVTIGEFEPPHFAVNITDVGGPIKQGETLRVNASVTNIGEVTDTQEVTVEIDGTVVTREELTLEAGEVRNISADWQPPAGVVGELEVEIESADDNMTASALVEAVEEEEQPESDSGFSTVALLLLLLLLLVILATGYYYYRRRQEE